MIAIDYKPGERQIRSFTRTWFPLFVAAFGALCWFRAGASHAAFIVWALGTLVWIGMLASAAFARFCFVGLIWATYPLGLALSYAALAFIFYVLFTPIGLCMRLLGRDPLALRARGRASHWVPYAQDDTPERAFRQF